MKEIRGYFNFLKIGIQDIPLIFDIYLKTINMKKKIIIITEKQAKNLINNLIIEEQLNKKSLEKLNKI